MNRHLLILDDDPNFLELYQFILCPPAFMGGRGSAVPAPQVTPFEVVTATTGEQALREVESAVAAHLRFAGVFVDLNLGEGLSGLETIRRLHASRVSRVGGCRSCQ